MGFLVASLQNIFLIVQLFEMQSSFKQNNQIRSCYSCVVIISMEFMIITRFRLVQNLSMKLGYFFFVFYEWKEIEHSYYID